MAGGVGNRKYKSSDSNDILGLGNFNMGSSSTSNQKSSRETKPKSSVLAASMDMIGPPGDGGGKGGWDDEDDMFADFGTAPNVIPPSPTKNCVDLFRC